MWQFVSEWKLIFDHFLQAGNMLHIHHDSCSSFLRRIDDIDPHSTHDGSPISIYDKEGRKKEKKKKNSSPDSLDFY